MKYGWAFILAAVLIVGAGGYYLISQQNQSKAAPDSLKKIEQLTPEEEQRLEIDRSVSGLGGELKQAERAEQGWFVLAEFADAEVNLEVTLETAQNVFSEFARLGITFDEAVTEFRTNSLRDVYGHPLKDVVIARIGLNGSTLERVNWQGFEFLNFPRITDDFWLHDELQKQWKELENRLRSESDVTKQRQLDGEGGGGQGGGTGNTSSGGGGPA